MITIVIPYPFGFRTLGPLKSLRVSHPTTGFLLVNLGFSSRREVLTRFDTRLEIGRNWDQIPKLRNETCLMEWLSMGGGILPRPKISVYVGKSASPSISLITDQIFVCFGTKPYLSIRLGPYSHGDPQIQYFPYEM